MYHSSVHSQMDWWAACKSRRRSGWVLGAVGAKDKGLSVTAGKDSIITLLGMDVLALRWPLEAAHSSKKMGFKLQIQFQIQCKDLFRSPTKQVPRGPALDPFWSKEPTWRCAFRHAWRADPYIQMDVLHP